MPELDALDHEPHVRRAIDLAREAGDRGDGPYGSLLVRDGDVVMEETNRENTDDDIALHPELTLARRAARELDADARAEAVMYTSTEPCPMCAGGIAIAGLGGVVYRRSSPNASGKRSTAPKEFRAAKSSNAGGARYRSSVGC
ncbi:nucleoside deaminase [Halorussus ruber]|uniref:nucleoside deaminase n=1 Tax=Halorussus ruber TaxID=1126238 RepID=UPI001B300081|nr:nucleoside deaminase [Halorussus ruber]